MEKMDAISQTTFSNAFFFMNEQFLILIQMSLKFIPKVLIDNKSVLVQVMAWRRTGDKPLPKSVIIQFIDACMRHEGMMC